MFIPKKINTPVISYKIMIKYKTGVYGSVFAASKTTQRYIIGKTYDNTPSHYKYSPLQYFHSNESIYEATRLLSLLKDTHLLIKPQSHTKYVIVKAELGGLFCISQPTLTSPRRFAGTIMKITEEILCLHVR